MRKKKGLSERQLQMLEKLKKRGAVRWSETISAETQSINSLVKRGLVEVHRLKSNGDYCRETYWTLK